MLRLASAVLAALVIVAGAAMGGTSTHAAGRSAQSAAPLRLAQLMGNFYLYEFEQQKGPFSPDELIAEISAGNIGKSAYVWQPGMDEWAPIESIPEFAAAFAPEIELPRPYYVVADGERLGPFTDTEMQIRILDLLSGPDDLAWRSGLDDWTPLRDFPEFADQLAAAVVPPPPRAGEGGDGGEPPPLPGEADEAPFDAAMTILWAKLQMVVEGEVPSMVSNATSREHGQITACVLELMRPVDPAVWQIVVEANMRPDAAQFAEIERLSPGLSAGVGKCVDDATAMKDALDAMLWGAASAAFPDNEELSLGAYLCLREATEIAAPEHRQEVVDATDGLDETAIGILDGHYPGYAARVEGCLIADAIAPPMVDEPAPPVVDQPDTPPPAGLIDAIESGLIAGGMPVLMVSQMAPCVAARLQEVASEAELQAIIANGLTDALGQQLEAAHPGIGDSLMACVPKDVAF